MVFEMLSSEISVNDSCLLSVGCESGPNHDLLETLKMVPNSAMSDTWHKKWVMGEFLGPLNGVTHYHALLGLPDLDVT